MTNIGYINPYAYSAVSQGNTGKLYVPVNQSAVFYAQFDYVSGVAAREGENGVSINRIQILNSLIAHIRTTKSAQNLEASRASNSNIDLLITDYQQKIRETMQTTPFVMTGMKPTSGEIFTISA